MKKIWLLTFALSSVIAASAQAATIDLGQAASYNAFIKDNFTANTSDTRGSLAVGDKSEPELIYKLFSMSKGTFKKAIGGLYKQGLIRIHDDRIELLDS